MLLLIIVVGLAGFLLLRASWNLYSMASDQPLPVARSTALPGVYPQARSKLNNFLSDPAIRSVTLSEADVNAMLADAPELGSLQKGVNVVFHDNEVELRLRIPLHLIPFSTKYLNYEVFLRPIISEEKVMLNVLRVTSAGKPLDPIALRSFQGQAEPSLNQVLSALNEIQQSRAIKGIRIQDGVLRLER